MTADAPRAAMTARPDASPRPPATGVEADLPLVIEALRQIKSGRWSFAAPEPLASQVGKVCWRLRHPEAPMRKPYCGRWARRRLDRLAAEGLIEYRRCPSYYEYMHRRGRMITVRVVADRVPFLTRKALT